MSIIHNDRINPIVTVFSINKGGDRHIEIVNFAVIAGRDPTGGNPPTLPATPRPAS